MAIAASVALVFPASAVAGPLLNLSNLTTPGYAVPSGQVLDVNDWLMLEERDDNGWHLGWLKRNEERRLDDRRSLGRPGGGESGNSESNGGRRGGTSPGGGSPGGETSSGGGTNPGGGTSGGGSPNLNPDAWVPTSDPIGDLPPGSLLPTSQGPELFPTGSGSAAPIELLAPEPTSLVLLGTGLLMTARRWRAERSRG